MKTSVVNLPLLKFHSIQGAPKNPKSSEARIYKALPYVPQLLPNTSTSLGCQSSEALLHFPLPEVQLLVSGRFQLQWPESVKLSATRGPLSPLLHQLLDGIKTYFLTSLGLSGTLGCCCNLIGLLVSFAGVLVLSLILRCTASLLATCGCPYWCS